MEEVGAGLEGGQLVGGRLGAGEHRGLALGQDPGALASLPSKKATLWGTASWLSKLILNGRFTGPARQSLLKATSLAAMERGSPPPWQPLAASFLALTSQASYWAGNRPDAVKRIAWWASPQYSVHWPP